MVKVVDVVKYDLFRRLWASAHRTGPVTHPDYLDLVDDAVAVLTARGIVAEDSPSS